MRFIDWLRHKLFCRDVSWAYPTGARWDNDPTHTYPLRCVECGYTERITGIGLASAVDRQFASPPQPGGPSDAVQD